MPVLHQLHLLPEAVPAAELAVQPVQAVLVVVVLMASPASRQRVVVVPDGFPMELTEPWVMAAWVDSPH